MKIALILFSLLYGVYMFFDGIYVMLNGKYFGPEKPGPWSVLFEKLGISPFKLGPLFITYGILWFILIIGLLTKASWIFWYAAILSFMTLWYLPIGTIISVIVIVMLFLLKSSRLK